MKKILILSILALLCTTAFSQADTSAIFHIADSLNDLGDKYYDDKKYIEALVLYTQASEMTKDINEGYNDHYATALYNIAWVYKVSGDNQKSLEFFIQTKEIRKKIFGEDNAKYARLLNSISVVYDDMSDYQTALKYKIQAMEIRKKVLGEDHPDYAGSLNDIGIVYEDMGDFQTALKYKIQAMEIRKKVLGEEHPDYASSLNNVGITYREMGDFQNALKCYRQALAIKKKVLGEEHPDYAASLYSIAIVYYSMADYQSALKYLLQTKEIERKTLGEEDPGYASTLNAIGTMYNKMADYQNALKYFNNALDIYKKSYGEVHPSCAGVMSNIGYVYYNMDDAQTALKYYMQSMEIRKKTLGEEHSDYAASLNNVANVYDKMGDYQNALKYYFQSMEIRKNFFGEEHSEYAASLNNIGWVYKEMGDYQNSMKYHLQSLAIKEKIYGKVHFDNAYSLTNIGDVYKEMGDYQNALKYYTQAMQVREKVNGNEHPLYAKELLNIGIVSDLMRDYANAVTRSKQATDIQKQHLIRNFSFMTTHEREAYWDSNSKYFYANIKIMYHSPDDTLATKTSYDSELVTKGLLLASEINMTNIIMESGDTALISEYEDTKTMHLLLNKEQEKPIAERTYNCDSLENEIQKAERHIMEKSKEFGDITNFIKIDWKDVQKSLKDNDVAIEFSNFTENDTTKFVALVLTKRMEAPVCVPLFNNFEMQKLIRGVAPAKTETPTEDENRGATTVAAKRQGIYESTGLYKMLWKPLEKYFPANPRIYFAPSGMLYQIAIEYAPIDHEKTISDKYEIYRVSSTRFLAMDYMPKPMKNSVLYGGVYYDSDTAIMKQESDRYLTRRANGQYVSSLSRSVDREGLNYLPGTKTEVENIVGTLKKKKKVKTMLYEGSQANEESFKALSGEDISVLHIATHGFFLPTDEKLSGDQSLVQSGLLLSGANYAWQNKLLPEGIEDGILTAKEISFMDLRKTDLVVLSACQTALGEITGEGVFGLQRGFKKAGVRTIIMSLWPVDDNATLLMMTEFYANLTKGMTKREAFLAAQNKVKTTPGFENPRYWAAFIMLDGNER